jgi:hypothetical protein
LSDYLVTLLPASNPEDAETKSDDLDNLSTDELADLLEDELKALGETAGGSSA